MASATEGITLALRIIGVAASGESIDANDLLEAVDEANNMLEQWSLEDLMIYYDKVDIIPLIAGQISYSIGPTGTDLVTTRPIEILSAAYRSSNLDYPVIVKSHQDYQRVVQKTTTGNTFPEILAYQPTNPNGTILIWPVPTSGLTLRILSNKLFISISEPSIDMVLPIGYKDCFVYGLAERLCLKYGRLDLLPLISEKARNSKMIVKRKNTKKTTRIMNGMFLSKTNAIYNPYSDN